MFQKNYNDQKTLILTIKNEIAIKKAARISWIKKKKYLNRMVSNFLVVLLAFFKRNVVGILMFYLYFLVYEIVNMLLYKNYFKYVLLFILVNLITFSLLGFAAFGILSAFIFKNLIIFFFSQNAKE